MRVEHVPQIAFWIEPIQLSRSDQAIKDGSAFSPGIGTDDMECSSRRNGVCTMTRHLLEAAKREPIAARILPYLRLTEAQLLRAKYC